MNMCRGIPSLVKIGGGDIGHFNISIGPGKIKWPQTRSLSLEWYHNFRIHEEGPQRYGIRTLPTLLNVKPCGM